MDESVIGRAFYVMGYLGGRCFTDNALPGLASAERGAIFDEANRVIAALHAMDPVTLGLADFGKSEDFLPRQIARWTRLYRLAETAAIPAMENLMA